MTRHADKRAAADKYEEFHRYPPKKIGEFPSGFTIPEHVYVGGRGKWVTYRSTKVDPATLRKPRKPVDYIHEFDAGVTVYLPRTARNIEFALDGDGKRRVVDVPREFRAVDALTKLGDNLGFCFEDAKGDEIEAVSQAPMPELYAVPSGQCLVVVQSKRTVIAMIWGGALGVFARGIDG